MGCGIGLGKLIKAWVNDDGSTCIHNKKFSYGFLPRHMYVTNSTYFAYIMLSLYYRESMQNLSSRNNGHIIPDIPLEKVLYLCFKTPLQKWSIKVKDVAPAAKCLPFLLDLLLEI